MPSRPVHFMHVSMLLVFFFNFPFVIILKRYSRKKAYGQNTNVYHCLKRYSNSITECKVNLIADQIEIFAAVSSFEWREIKYEYDHFVYTQGNERKREKKKT